MQTFLVTGAAGFIGSHSVEWLLARGCRVVGVDNLRTGRLENLEVARVSPDFEWILADAGDEVGMRTLFEQHRFAGVLHLAALVSVPESFREPALNYRLNLAVADSMARLCLEFECRRLVFASSAAVYGATAALPNRESATPQPQSPYAAAKLAAEVMLLGYAASYGLEAVCLRYFNVYGPRQDPNGAYAAVIPKFAHLMIAGQEPIVHGDGQQSRDFIYVHDVARANLLACISERAIGQVFNIATGSTVAVAHLVDLINEILGTTLPAQFAPPRAGDLRHSEGDPDRAATLLGFRASGTFAEHLATTVRALKNGHLHKGVAYE